MSDFTVGRFGTTERPSFGTILGSAVAVFSEMLKARATRRLLRDLDDRQLSDIGVGRGDALHESLRPMWDLTPRQR